MKIVVQTGDESLKNQMQMLLETRAGSVPVDRDFGIRWEGLDELPEVAESLFYQEVLKKCRTLCSGCSNPKSFVSDRCSRTYDGGDRM